LLKDDISDTISKQSSKQHSHGVEDDDDDEEEREEKKRS